MTTTYTWMFTTRLSGTHMHISAASAVIDFILLRRLCTSVFPFCILVLHVLFLSLLPTYLIFMRVLLSLYLSLCVFFFLAYSLHHFFSFFSLTFFLSLNIFLLCLSFLTFPTVLHLYT
jgi:hypothetical protein